MKMRMVFVLVVCVFLDADFVGADDWTTINMPEASYTYPQDIDGDNVVGFYMTEVSYPYDRGFLYKMTEDAWTLLDMPNAIDTTLTGIYGNRIVGGYQDASGETHGLIYDLKTSTWGKFDIPGESTTFLCGIDGDNVIGTYGGGTHGFVYDLTGATYDPKESAYDLGKSTWTNLDITGTSRINPRGISGDKIVGDYRDAIGSQYGFLYYVSDSSWINLDMPDAPAHSTDPLNIDGINIVGRCNNSAFLCDISDINNKKWSYLDAPEAEETEAFGIDGDKIVGFYTMSPAQGFIYVIPEPSTLALLIAGSVVFWRRRKQRQG